MEPGVVTMIGSCMLILVALTPQEVAAKALPAVVAIKAGAAKGTHYGTGFYVAPDIVVTNFHVMRECTAGTAKVLGSKKEHAIEGVVAEDPGNDLVLLKIAPSAASVLPLQEEDAVRVGDDVFVVGNPDGLEGTFSRGMISGKRKIKSCNLLQMTAPISSGSSGGPVLSIDGKVVGVSVASMQRGQNLNFAVPAAAVGELLRRQHEVKPVASLAGLPKPLGLDDGQVVNPLAPPGEKPAPGAEPGGPQGKYKFKDPNGNIVATDNPKQYRYRGGYVEIK